MITTKVYMPNLYILIDDRGEEVGALPDFFSCNYGANQKLHNGSKLDSPLAR